jgi:ABC-type transport system involved in multi-copper enzyme maturation permease subunit
LRSIPDYFIGSNTGALLQNQNQYLGFFGASSPSSTISDLHAVVVLLVYIVVFVGLAVWLNQKRDITN